VLLNAGGPSVTRTLAMHLFSRMSEFNPWAMCLVLQIVRALSTPLSSLHSPCSHADAAFLFSFSPLTTFVCAQALRHSPTEDDMYDILNVLEDRLKHNNAAVIFTVLQAFLHLTDVRHLRGCHLVVA
jgi:hypothetical protein